MKEELRKLDNPVGMSAWGSVSQVAGHARPSRHVQNFNIQSLSRVSFLPVHHAPKLPLRACAVHRWISPRLDALPLRLHSTSGGRAASLRMKFEPAFKCTLPLLKGKSQKLAIPLARNNVAAIAQHSPLCRHLRAPLALLFLYQTRIYPSLEDDWQLFHCFQRLWDQLIIAYVNELHVVNGWWSAESSRIHVRPSKCHAPARYPSTFPITLSVHRHWIGPSASAHPKWS